MRVRSVITAPPVRRLGALGADDELVEPVRGEQHYDIVARRPTPCTARTSRPYPGPPMRSPRTSRRPPRSSSGNMIGMNSTARMKSLPFVFTDIVASSVPTPAMPTEPPTSTSGEHPDRVRRYPLALQEQEREDRDGEHLDDEQEDEVADRLGEEDDRAVDRREQQRVEAALVLLVHERAVQPEHRREDEREPQQPAAMRRTSKPSPACESAI